jgi:predicted nuclease of restriction endonuclease-like (RecB) superfamily
MIKFNQLFEDIEIVQALIAQLTWTHIQILLPIEDNLKREFYIGMIKLDRWSTRTLKERIDSQLYERTALSKKPEELISYEVEQLNKGEITPDIVLKDPYLLDFLELNDRYLEKDLEDAILSELEQFILELDKSNIHVAQYLTVLPKRELLQEKLQLAIQNAKNRLEFRDEEK